MSNLPLVKGTLDYSNPKMLDTIRATVAVNATDAELAMFVAFCESTGLNPFKKEIWFIKTKLKQWTGQDGRPVVVEPKVTMMTGINGFFQIANRHPQYDGMDEPEFVEGPNGLPVKCTVRAYRKDRSRPSVGIARWSEYFPGPTKKGEGQWEKRPFHMLAKVAKAIALRELFPQELNGLFTDDEASDVEAVDVTEQERPVEINLIKKPKKALKVDVKDAEPEWLPAPAPDPLQNAIDGEDWMTVGNHIIETKCSLQGMTVRDATETKRETLVANLKRFKSENDRKAVSAYLEAHPPKWVTQGDITITDEDLGGAHASE